MTDNAVGTTYIENDLEIRAANARLDPDLLARYVADTVGLDVEIDV